MTRIGLVAQISRLRLAAVLGALGALGLVSPAGADEAKTPINASLFLSIMSAPVERREAAFDEALKGSGPPPLERGGVVQPDGSVRYGNVSVTVKNPCPPGTAHYEAPPLPGRRLRTN
jgi:hypothetical protein